MSQQYASGKFAKATCDRCGFTVKYTELKKQIFNLRWTGMMVCRSCLDKDHPQLQLGRTPINDPQALREARPDINKIGATSYYGFDPVRGETMTASLGNVRVTIT